MHIHIYIRTYIHLHTCVVNVHIVIFIAGISAEDIVHKSFDQSIQLNCPACNSNAPLVSMMLALLLVLVQDILYRIVN